MRPDLEELESRIPLAADTIYLDFNWAGYSVYDEFRFSNQDYSRRKNPYDLNKDRKANLKDYRIFVTKIIHEAENILPEEMGVVPVDIFRNEGSGEKIREEKAGFVVEMGGYTRPFAFGEAWLARPGENMAGSAWVYTGNLMEYSVKSSAAVRIRGIANTIGRVWGHLVGIAHTEYSDNDIMTANFDPKRQFAFQSQHRPEILDSIYAQPFSAFAASPLPIS